MSRIMIESRIGDQEPVTIQAQGQYWQRGYRGRLCYEWAPDPEKPSETVKETLDMEWEPQGNLYRILRRQEGVWMEFVSGKQTKGRVATPAGELALCLKTRELSVEKSEKNLLLKLVYELGIGDQPQGLTRIHIRLFDP